MSRSELLSLARSTYTVSGNGVVSVAQSGVIAAAVPARSLLWAWAVPTSLPEFPIVIERLRLQYTCITAFTTPVTAGRSLAFGFIPTLGAAITGNERNTVRKTNLSHDTDPVIANTAPVSADLVATNTLFARMSLAGFGTAGASKDQTWEWTTGSAQMISILAGTLLALTNPVAMDAAGTFEIVVEANLMGVPDGYPP